MSLNNFDFTVTYRPGLRNQDPDALSRCPPGGHDYKEVEDDIPKFEATALVLALVQALNRENEEEDETLEEEVDFYNVWDELSDPDRVNNFGGYSSPDNHHRDSRRVAN